MLLIGMDRIKDEGTLLRAYDDRQGVTAAFNLNLLHRINRELDGDIPIDAFRHVARWNAWEKRIEMHLVATCDVTFAIDGQRFSMASGETVHTENSHKFDLDGARLLLRAGAWTPIREWTDPENKFALLLAEAQPAGTAP
jgi:L-histidine N-alpha-methyltransferase